jgi:ribosome biogenesis GTPase
MSKRRLSKQQQSRIAEKQQKEIVADTEMGTGGNVASNKCNGCVISHFGQQLDVETLDTPESPRLVRCHQRANLPDLVTGDLVVWEKDTEENGIIVAVAERQNMFARPDASGTVKAVAANIDVVLVVFAVLPEAFMNLIDRYLVAIHKLGLEPLLVLNKADLLNEENSTELDNMLSIYQSLGYPTHRLSALTGDGVARLEEALSGRTTVLVGQSGVGKSSLINRLGLAQMTEVGELSEGKYKGTHKTTTARLYHLNNCDVIDSPGIREFNLGQLSQQQLLIGFRELQDFAGACKFRDCSHRSEPGCAIREAVKRGEVFPERLESYLRILRMMENP